MMACDLYIICLLGFVKHFPLVSPGILSTFYSIDSYHALKISLNVPTEIPFCRTFPKILRLSPISVITQRFILLAIDSFVLTLPISFIARSFLPSAMSFQYSISLSNYQTNSLELIFFGGTP